MIAIKRPVLNESVERETTNRSGASLTWIRPDGSAVDMAKVDNCISAALSNLSVIFPSVFYVVNRYPIYYTDDENVDTMATDGVSIFVNPAWVERVIARAKREGFKPVVGMEFVFIHEAMHNVFSHTFGRLGSSVFAEFGFDTERINIAQDYEVNWYIENILRPDSNFDRYKGMTEKMEGLYNDDYAHQSWRSIIKSIPPTPIEKKIKPTSKKWKDGFMDGLLGALQKMREQGLIEHLKE